MRVVRDPYGRYINLTASFRLLKSPNQKPKCPVRFFDGAFNVGGKGKFLIQDDTEVPDGVHMLEGSVSE